MHWRVSIYHVANIQVERYKWERMWDVHEPVLGLQSLCAVPAQRAQNHLLGVFMTMSSFYCSVFCIRQLVHIM